MAEVGPSHIETADQAVVQLHPLCTQQIGHPRIPEFHMGEGERFVAESGVIVSNWSDCQKKTAKVRSEIAVTGRFAELVRHALAKTAQYVRGPMAGNPVEYPKVVGAQGNPVQSIGCPVFGEEVEDVPSKKV